MKTVAVVLAGASLALLGASGVAQAQTGADAKKDGVNEYLCAFAGKCGGAEEAAPTIAAPATKGFRLAAPQTASQPSMAAPSTKGFRLAAPQQSAPTVSAPPTRSFRLAGAAPVAPAPAARPARVRHIAKAPAAPTVATPRANLMLAFEYNSDRLTPAAQDRARTFAQALVTPELRDKRFLIEGHTDSKGSRDLNVDLSRRRAQSVADFLVKNGVDSSRVEVKGVGPDEPLPGQSASSEANRRVEAVLLS